MKLLALTTLIMLSGFSAYAKKDCTLQPKDTWMTEEAFKKKAEGEGYKIRKFKTPGTCYEIYGTKDGKDVEVYFDPVSGTPAK